MAHPMGAGRCAAAVLALIVVPAVAPADPQPVTQLGSDRFRQTNPVAGIAFSADGKRLATIDGDAIHIWDALDGRLLSTTRIRNHELLAVAFEAGSDKLVAGAHFDRQTWICRFDPAADKPPSRRALMMDKGTCLFSPGGKYLAVGHQFRNASGTFAEVVETLTGKVVLSDWRQEELFRSFAFRGDDKVVAISIESGRIRVHDLNTGKVLHEFRIEGGKAAGMTFSPNGKDLVAEIVASESTHLACFELESGELRWRHEAHLAKNPAYSADGTSVRYYGVASNSANQLAWRWLDANSGKPLSYVLFADQGALATRTDGKVLAIGGKDGLISQWDVESRKRLDDGSADPCQLVNDVRFTPDGKKVRGWARGWYEWDLNTGNQLRLTPPIEAGLPAAIDVSEDQRWSAQLVRDLDRGSVTLELVDSSVGTRVQLHAAPSTRSIKFIPKNRLLVSDDKELTLFHLNSSKRPTRVKLIGDTPVIAISDDGTTAVEVAGIVTGVRVTHWHLDDSRRGGSWEFRLTDSPKTIETIMRRARLSSDGALLAIPLALVEVNGREMHESGIFQTRSGRLVSKWFDECLLSDLKFSPDGRAFAVDAGLELAVREAATGGVRWLGPPFRPASACGFSPDGRQLAVATRPRPIEIYDLYAEHSRIPWDPDRQDQIWEILAKPDAGAAFRTVGHLRANPKAAVAFLRERVKAPDVPTRDWVAGRIRDLDSPSYWTREKATADLAGAGEFISDLLREAQTSASLEVRERIGSLIPKLTTVTPAMLRATRACEVLEGIGTAEARSLLADWVKLAPGTTLGREAAESLDRLRARTR